MSILQEQTIEQHLALYLTTHISEQSQLSQYSLKLRQHILHLRHLQELLRSLLQEQVQQVLSLLSKPTVMERLQL